MISAIRLAALVLLLGAAPPIAATAQAFPPPERSGAAAWADWRARQSGLGSPAGPPVRDGAAAYREWVARQRAAPPPRPLHLDGGEMFMTTRPGGVR